MSLITLPALAVVGLLLMEDTDMIRKVGRVAFKLITRLLSYPVVLILIAGLHLVSCGATMIRYTAGWVGGEPLKKISVKVLFD